MCPFPAPVIDEDNKPFWTAAGHGKLEYQYCRNCDKFWYPPGPVCPRCQKADFDWRAVDPRGVLVFSVKYHKRYFDSAEVPYVVAQVELKEGIRVTANVIDPKTGDLATERPPDGSTVEIVFGDFAAQPSQELGQPVRTPCVRVV